MITVIIADDHRLFLDGLRQSLDSVPDISVSHAVEDGGALLDTLVDQAPDLLLVDLEMPGTDGLTAIGSLTDPPPTIIVTMHADDATKQRAADAGAVGFLSKSTPLPDLAAAIRAAVAGENLIESDDLRALLDGYQEAELDPGAAALTARERELLGLLAMGVSSTEDLADQLFISQKTVKNHLASIYEKLAVNDRTQAAIEAIRLGLVADG